MTGEPSGGFPSTDSAINILAHMARDETLKRPERLIALFHELTPQAMATPHLLLLGGMLATDAFAAHGTKVDLIQYYHIIGYAHQCIGSIDLALHHLEEARIRAVGSSDERAEARANALLGQMARQRHDYEHARQHLERALQLYTRHSDSRGEAQTLGDLANLADDEEDFPEAIRLYRKSWTLFRRQHDVGSQSQVQWDLSTACVRRGRVSDGLAHGLLAIGLRRNAGQAPLADSMEWELAAVAAQSGLPELQPNSATLRKWGTKRTIRAARAAAASVAIRADLCHLADFDPDYWELHSDLVLNPEAAATLEEGARHSMTSEDPLRAVAMRTMASVLESARTLAPHNAVESYVERRELLLGSESAPSSAVLAALETADLLDWTTADLDAFVRHHRLNQVGKAILEVALAEVLKRTCEASADPDRAIEACITLLEDALQVLRPDVAGLWWLTAKRDLGSLHRARLRGGRGTNLRTAIAHLEAAASSDLPLTTETFKAWLGCRVNLANAYLFYQGADRLARVEEALSLLQECLPLSRYDPSVAATCLNSLGLAYTSRVLGNPSENEAAGMSVYHQALGICRDTEPALRGTILQNIGLCLSRSVLDDVIAKAELATNYMEWAVDRYDEAGHHLSSLVARGQLALTRARSVFGDKEAQLRSGIEELERIRGDLLALGDLYEAAGQDNNIGNLYLDMHYVVEEGSDALAGATEAVSRARDVWVREDYPVEWARATHNLANALAAKAVGGERAKIEEAADLYRAAMGVRTLEAFPAEAAETRRALADCLMLAQDDAPESIYEAEELYASVLALGVRAAADAVPAMVGMAEVARARADWDSVARYLEGASELTEQQVDVSVMPASKLHGLIQGQPLSVAAAYALGVAGDPLKCIMLLERSRVRVMGESIGRDPRHLAELRATHPTLLNEYLTASQAFAAATRLHLSDLRPATARSDRPLREWVDAAEARAALRMAEARISELPGLEEFASPIDVEGLRRLAERLGAIAYLFVSEDRVCVAACWSAGQSLEATLMVGEPGSGSRIHDGLVSGTAGEAQDVQERSFALAQLGLVSWDAVRLDALAIELGSSILPSQFWDWLDERDIAQLCLVPAGLLVLAPWHAAVSPFGGGARLVDRTTIRYAPCARFVSATEPLPIRADSFVVAGDPVDDLPSARQEASELSVLLETDRCFLGCDATRSVIIAALTEGRCLHFAGHGRYCAEDPLASGLRASDGWVTMEDLIGISRPSSGHASLAVLSACQTAVADVLSLPDEAIALPTVMLVSGVGGVVASLWPVPDDSTRALMDLFYRSLLDGSAPDEALACAQRAMSNSGLWSVDDWAAFVLVGG